MNKSANTQIRNILLVLGSGISLAFVFLIFTLLHYGHNGRYDINAILLSPDVAKQLSYLDHDSGSGKMQKFEYDHIEIELSGKLRKSLSMKKYSEIYQLISGDKSINDPNKRVIGLFRTKIPNRIILFIKPIGAGESSHSFQEFQYLGDYYRVELRNSNYNQPYAYFYHPNLSKKINTIINE